MILGYRRKGNSRKNKQMIQFAQPMEVPELSRTLADPSVPMPETITLTRTRLPYNLALSSKSLIIRSPNSLYSSLIE